MKIIDAYWTPKINILTIQCSCGTLFKSRADRIRVICPKCDKVGNMFRIKEKRK